MHRSGVIQKPAIGGKSRRMSLRPSGAADGSRGCARGTPTAGRPGRAEAVEPSPAKFAMDRCEAQPVSCYVKRVTHKSYYFRHSPSLRRVTALSFLKSLL